MLSEILSEVLSEAFGTFGLPVFSFSFFLNDEAP